MERKRKPMSEQQAFNQLATRCAAAEYCLDDMRRKMTAWELPEGAEERILQKLVQERFVDEQRYAAAFARDKFRYNRWGERRIALELERRHIASDTIQEALEQLDETEALKTLQALLQQKQKSTRGRNPYEINMKLMRFALSRGFSMDQARQCIDRLDASDCDAPAPDDNLWD